MRKALLKCTALLFAMTTIAACPLSAEASTLKTEDGIRYIQYDSGEAKPYTGWTAKAGKRYYVRVQGFKKVGKAYYYGAWSKTVNVVIRKK